MSSCSRIIIQTVTAIQCYLENNATSHSLEVLKQADLIWLSGLIQQIEFRLILKGEPWREAVLQFGVLLQQVLQLKYHQIKGGFKIHTSPVKMSFFNGQGCLLQDLCRSDFRWTKNFPCIICSVDLNFLCSFSSQMHKEGVRAFSFLLKMHQIEPILNLLWHRVVYFNN